MLLHYWWEYKWLQPWRRIQRFLKKLYTELLIPHDPAITFQGIYPEKTIIQKDICTPGFTEALFTIAKTWKQFINRPTGKEEVVHIYNGVLPSSKNEWNNIICSNMNKLRDSYSQWYKSNRNDKYHMNIAYRQNLRSWYKWTYLQTELESQI